MNLMNSLHFCPSTLENHGHVVAVNGNVLVPEMTLLSLCSLNAVSGEANSDMENTALTVGDFTQPIVAKSLIELPASSEKGLTQ